MPRTAKSKSAAATTTKASSSSSSRPRQKSKIISHTQDGIPIVNATMAQIRKGGEGPRQQLVRVPQVAERSRLYAETAEVIGERESFALPYHGGRMWKCEVKLSDDNGAYGDNGKNLKLKGNVNLDRSRDSSSLNAKTNPKKKGNSRQKSLTPLFRWYRGKLELATLPHILEDVVEVDAKMPSKKRWANMSDDELDSSDDEWDDFLPQSDKVIMEISALTTSAWEDPDHPLPNISRTWISPDLQRFQSRKSALAHAEKLVQRDLLIDRILYGYGKNGVRLRPVKPTRKAALDAGMARFVRDGLWVVGQEEMWIEKRREILVKKQMKRLEAHDEEEGENEEEEDMEAHDESAVEDSKVPEYNREATEGQDESAVEDSKMPAHNNDSGNNEETSAGKSEMNVNNENNNDFKNDDTKEKKEQNKITSDSSKVISPAESDASSHDGSEQNAKPVAVNASSATDAIDKDSSSKRQLNKIPPPFTPSTHYRLTPAQIDKCYSACIEHYETVMRTVKARSLHHELSDGFDVLRERGRGRFDMELPAFDTDAFSFLTDLKKSAWMPVVHKILGEDAILVHKGCFLSLPGSETQVYHQDGVHLNKKSQKPCHAVNVFIPLIDYDMTNGPTEFCLGTHYLGYENFVKEMVYTPCVTAGTPVIFDYRLGHRGLKNTSQSCRPVVYLTYSSVASGKEFRDSVNFSRKRYRKLGEFVERPLSREERANKRRKDK